MLSSHYLRLYQVLDYVECNRLSVVWRYYPTRSSNMNIFLSLKHIIFLQLILKYREKRGHTYLWTRSGPTVLMGCLQLSPRTAKYSSIWKCWHLRYESSSSAFGFGLLFDFGLRVKLLSFN